MKSKFIYVDNAATSFPKPLVSSDAVSNHYLNSPGSPGRGSYEQSIRTARLVEECREEISLLIGLDDPRRLIFCSGATEALNLAILGLAKENTHILTTEFEHNSVLRPLNFLAKSKNIEITFLPPDSLNDETVVSREISSNTSLLVISHVSNVTGEILPIDLWTKIAKDKGIPILIDGSQAAGMIDFSLSSWPNAHYAFTGHKSLLGPTGTGCLALPEYEPFPDALKRGGTGFNSESQDQPRGLPHFYESGTPNTLGLVGLNSSVKYLRNRGVSTIQTHEVSLAASLLEILREEKNITIYTDSEKKLTNIILLNISSLKSEEVGSILDKKYNIMARCGLHCSPLIHSRLGTEKQGAVRISLGPFNSEEQIAKLSVALSSISRFR